MLTINKYDNTVAFVVIPKDATDIECLWTSLGYQIYYNNSTKKDNTIDLPPGKWELLFRDSEATEKDCKKIVEDCNPGFKDYSDALLNVFPFKKASDSYASLIRAHSIQLTEHQDLLILKKVEK